MSEQITVVVAWTVGDLAFVPVGTRIATNHNKIMQLDQLDTPEYPEAPPVETGFGPLDSDNWKEWRKDKAKWEAKRPQEARYWIEPMTLMPLALAEADWFPAVILPPVVKHDADLEQP